MAQRQFHPVADLFPAMAEDELQSLADDIKANGLQVPIVVDGEGQILDGRHRFLACERAGVEPEFRVATSQDFVALVASLNAKRRNLSAGQRAMAAAEAWDMVETKVGRPSKKVPKNGDLSGGRAVTLATMFGVAKGYVEQARFIVVNDPPAAAAVKAGTTRLGEAHEAARQRANATDSQHAMLERLAKDDAELASMVADEKLTLAGALAELRERKEQARLERQAAMDNLHGAMSRLSPFDGDPKMIAEGIWKNWDPDLWPPGPLKPDRTTITKCSAVLGHLATLAGKAKP